MKNASKFLSFSVLSFVLLSSVAVFKTQDVYATEPNGKDGVCRADCSNLAQVRIACSGAGYTCTDSPCTYGTCGVE